MIKLMSLTARRELLASVRQSYGAADWVDNDADRTDADRTDADRTADRTATSNPFPTGFASICHSD